MMVKSLQKSRGKADKDFAREIAQMLLPSTIKEYRDNSKMKEIRAKMDALYLEIFNVYKADISSLYSEKGFDGDYVASLNNEDFLKLMNKTK